MVNSMLQLHPKLESSFHKAQLLFQLRPAGGSMVHCGRQNARGEEHPNVGHQWIVDPPNQRGWIGTRMMWTRTFWLTMSINTLMFRLLSSNMTIFEASLTNHH